MRRKPHAETAALPPACRAAHSLFFAYLDGELPPTKTVALEAHTHQCARCRRALSFSRQSEEALASALRSVPAPGDLQAGFQARLAQKQARPQFWRILPLAAPALATAALALVWLHPMRLPMPTANNPKVSSGVRRDAITSTFIPGPSHSFASQGEGRLLFPDLPTLANERNPIRSSRKQEKSQWPTSQTKGRSLLLSSSLKGEEPVIRVASAKNVRHRRYRLRIISYAPSAVLAFKGAQERLVRSRAEVEQRLSRQPGTATIASKPTVIALNDTALKEVEAEVSPPIVSEVVELQVQDDTRHFISRVQADSTEGTVITDEATADTEAPPTR